MAAVFGQLQVELQLRHRLRAWCCRGSSPIRPSQTAVFAAVRISSAVSCVIPSLEALAVRFLVELSAASAADGAQRQESR